MSLSLICHLWCSIVYFLKDADFVDVKLVEKILGRRMSTRPIKGAKVKDNVSPKKDLSKSDAEEKDSTDEQNHSGKTTDHQLVKVEVVNNDDNDEKLEQEEEEEEQVEEFYLKYKGL